MATTVQQVVTLARPFLGDTKRKTADPDSDLSWDDESLASLAPASVGLLRDCWPQEYTVGSSLTDEYSPDPSSSTYNDLQVVALFLAKTALMNEAARFARRAAIYSGPAGSTNLRHIQATIKSQLDYVDGEIGRMLASRTSRSVAGDLAVKELRTEDSSLVLDP